MATVLFINETYLKNNSVVDENTDMKVIQPTIEDAQNIHLHPVLGSDLFNDLKDKIINDTLSVDEETLIQNYIAPMLLKWVLMELTTTMHFKYRNKNVSTKNSDNAVSVDYTEYRHLLDTWRDKAEWYTQRLIDYLCANSSTFPKYTSNSATDDLIPTDTSYRTSMWLGGGSSCNAKYKRIYDK
jgi:hypothetical protein